VTTPRVLLAPVTVTRGATVTAMVLVRATEPVFTGHYPGFPVLPGVCVIECVDRAARAAPPVETVELAAIDSARFLGPVRPGDELTVELGWSADGGDWCCRAEVSTARGRSATVRLRYRARRPNLGAAQPRGPEPGPGLGVDEITRLIPHRPPMLLLDRVDGLVPGERLTATWTVRADEPWSAEESPYPAVLLVESWCQAAGVLTVHGTGRESWLLLLGAVQGAELGGAVFPGETVEHRVRLSRSAADAAVLAGESCVDGRVVLRVRRIVVAMRPATELEEVG
jgi:3-hydroxymyristoyl/3-hydroxydecanoyl-(acyl carrier protein) dehydratase